MVGIAQLVRVSDCGPEGRGFDPHFPPKERQKATPLRCGFFIVWKYGNKIKVNEKKYISMVMDSYALFCGGYSVRHCGYFVCGDYVSQLGCLQYGNSLLHELALSPLGDQAILESVCRCHEDEALVDSGYATTDWRGFGWRRFLHSDNSFSSIHAMPSLVGGVQFGNA